MRERAAGNSREPRERSITKSPMLVFDCAAFAIVPGEDEETNEGIYGKSLAEWLAGKLRSAGVPVGDVIAEDFGWCIHVDSEAHSLYVACSGEAEEPEQWRVFVFAEGGLFARLTGRDTRAESVATLFAAVRRCIESAPDIRGLTEEIG
jgi:hypothetical protein